MGDVMPMIYGWWMGEGTLSNSADKRAKPEVTRVETKKVRCDLVEICVYIMWVVPGDPTSGHADGRTTTWVGGRGEPTGMPTGELVTG